MTPLNTQGPGQAAQGTLTRRSFLSGTARAVLGAAVVGAGSMVGLSACGKSSSNDAPDVLTVADSSVVTLDSFASIDDAEGYYKLVERGTFDAGTMMYTTGSKLAAALCAGKTASPLTTVSLVTLATGKMTKALEAAVQGDGGYSIYAVRASDQLLAWVESNYLTGDWSVYVATIDASSLKLGQSVQVDSGTSDYDTPELEVIGTTAYWIVQPAEGGSHTSEDSVLKASASGSRGSTILTSHGRFNGGLSASGEVLCAMPRADASGVYYQLTAIQSGTGSVVAKQVLPRSFKPATAIYLDGQFAFSIAASYDYGGGIARVGTYYPIGNDQYLRLARQPVTAPGLCQGWLFCKSGSRTVFVDCKNRRYFTVDAPGGTETYGDYPVCVGKTDTVYNYATIAKSTTEGTTRTVTLRAIEPNAV